MFALMDFTQWCGFMFICLVVCMGSALPVLAAIAKKAAKIS